MKPCTTWLVAMAGLLLAFGTFAQAEDMSTEERLRRLEEMVAKQQNQLEERDERIQQLETGYKHQQKIASITEGEYFAPSKSDDGNVFKFYWKDGLRFDSQDKRFKFKLGGRIMSDWIFGSADDFVQTDAGNGQNVRLGSSFRDGTEFRRVRWYISGQIYNNIIFKSQFNFAEDGEIEKEDMYLGIKSLPGLGTFKVGQFKQPQGLEQLTSSKYITMMERSTPTNVFTAGRKIGFMFNNDHFDERLQWGASLYKPDTVADGAFDDGFRSTGVSNLADPAFDGIRGGTSPSDDGDDLETQNNWGAGLRVTGTPWYVDDGKKLVHLGLWYAWEQAHAEDNGNSKTFRFRERPGVHIMDRLINTGRIPADYQHKFGAELAWKWGAASLQAEYFAAWVKRDDGTVDDQLNGVGDFPDADVALDDLFFHGFYAQFSYFITGEDRPYKGASGEFSRVKPKKNFWAGDGIGLGAWEFAARFDYIDLDSGGNPNTDTGAFGGFDEGARGGSQWSAVVGINWYLNPNTRFMWNYVHTEVDWPHAGDVANGTFDTGGPQPENSTVDAFMMRFQIDW